MQRAEKVARTVEHLLDAGAEGDLAAAKALVPWIDQAYGKPTKREEHRYPSSIDELKDMDEQELERSSWGPEHSKKTQRGTPGS